ncbi:MAG: hypothetical protein K6G73_11480 [Marinilabiliaceae bacterium]|jgi:predicted extracellular nuclease|nr:hypothetical protein [Bacteroidales bacterium]MCR5697581.1 hypothetical protein [Marinilabiliaceae bacterium]
MRIFILLIALFVFAHTYAQKSADDTLVIVSYNVENLFLPDDDPEKNDDAFTPAGDYRWTYERLLTKCIRIARVITTINKTRLPHIVGLLEVEGPRAVDALVRLGELNHCGYKPIAFPTPDARGIAPVLIYDTTRVKFISAEPLVVCDTSRAFLTRDVLCARFQYNNDDLLVLVNHWPSKYGGATETAWKRNYVAQKVRNYCDSITSREPNLLVVLIGDFNDTYDAEPLAKIFGALPQGSDYVNLSTDVNESSYKYRGVWGTIDHVVVSPSVIKRAGRPKFSVGRLPFLLEEDKYGGDKPFRTYIGRKYIDGYSDHLPVMVKINLAK